MLPEDVNPPATCYRRPHSQRHKRWRLAAKAGASGVAGGPGSPPEDRGALHALATLVVVAGSPVIALCPLMMGMAAPRLTERLSCAPSTATSRGRCGASDKQACFAPPLSGLTACGWAELCGLGLWEDVAALLLPDACRSPSPLAPCSVLPPPPALAGPALFYGALHAAHTPLCLCLAGSRCGALAALCCAMLHSLPLPALCSPRLTATFLVPCTQPWW